MSHTIIHAHFQLNRQFPKEILQRGGPVQKAIDNAVLRYSEPFVPYQTGTFMASARITTVLGSGMVEYPGSFAHYLYYGEVYGPNYPVFDDASGIPTRFYSPKDQKKHPTGRQLQFTKDHHPNATAFWFEHAKAAHLKDIIEEAESVARSELAKR